MGEYVYGDVSQGKTESSLGIESMGGHLRMLDEKVDSSKQKKRVARY